MGNARMTISAIFLLLFISTFCTDVKSTGSQDSTRPAYLPTLQDRNTLKGLKGVYVVVEDISEAEKLGLTLTTQQIQTNVELKLRRSGIKVLSEEERSKEPGRPYLYVNVNIYKNAIVSGDYPLIVYTASVQLTQQVYLVRDTKKWCYAATWEMEYVEAVRKSKIRSIRVFVKDIVDEFINDYLAVNSM